jgi:hypothetical protein
MMNINNNDNDSITTPVDPNAFNTVEFAPTLMYDSIRSSTSSDGGYPSSSLHVNSNTQTTLSRNIGKRQPRGSAEADSTASGSTGVTTQIETFNDKQDSASPPSPADSHIISGSPKNISRPKSKNESDEQPATPSSDPPKFTRKWSLDLFGKRKDSNKDLQITANETQQPSQPSSPSSSLPSSSTSQPGQTNTRSASLIDACKNFFKNKSKSLTEDIIGMELSLAFDHQQQHQQDARSELQKASSSNEAQSSPASPTNPTSPTENAENVSSSSPARSRAFSLPVGKLFGRSSTTERPEKKGSNNNTSNPTTKNPFSTDVDEQEDAHINSAGTSGSQRRRRSVYGTSMSDASSMPTTTPRHPYGGVWRKYRSDNDEDDGNEDGVDTQSEDDEPIYRGRRLMINPRQAASRTQVLNVFPPTMSSSPSAATLQQSTQRYLEDPLMVRANNIELDRDEEMELVSVSLRNGIGGNLNSVKIVLVAPKEADDQPKMPTLGSSSSSSIGTLGSTMTIAERDDLVMDFKMESAEKSSPSSASPSSSAKIPEISVSDADDSDEAPLEELQVRKDRSKSVDFGAVNVQQQLLAKKASSSTSSKHSNENSTATNIHETDPFACDIKIKRSNTTGSSPSSKPPKSALKKAPTATHTDSANASKNLGSASSITSSEATLKSSSITSLHGQGSQANVSTLNHSKTNSGSISDIKQRQFSSRGEVVGILKRRTTLNGPLESQIMAAVVAKKNAEADRCSAKLPSNSKARRRVGFSMDLAEEDNADEDDDDDLPLSLSQVNVAATARRGRRVSFDSSVF